MSNVRCDGKTFFGFTIEGCDQPATHHVYVDRYEQYDFCDYHYYYDQHGHDPEDHTSDSWKCCRVCNPDTWHIANKERFK